MSSVILDRKPWIPLTAPWMMEQWKMNTLDVESAFKGGYHVYLIRKDLDGKVAIIKNKELLFQKLNDYVEIRQSEFLRLNRQTKYHMSKRTLKRYKEDGTISFRKINKKHILLKSPKFLIEKEVAGV
jgi:hypothetical protein